MEVYRSVSVDVVDVPGCSIDSFIFVITERDPAVAQHIDSHSDTFCSLCSCPSICPPWITHPSLQQDPHAMRTIRASAHLVAYADVSIGGLISSQPHGTELWNPYRGGTAPPERMARSHRQLRTRGQDPLPHVDACHGDLVNEYEQSDLTHQCYHGETVELPWAPRSCY